MKSIIKKGDLGSVDEVLGWDCRGDNEEYEAIEKAQEAFDRIKKELSLQKKTAKESQQKYEELCRMTESYIKHLHAAEAENKKLKEALHKIADCGCPLVENEYGYTSELPECRRIAESVL